MANSVKNYLFLIPIACLISACDPVSERECGVFDHPDFNTWQSDSAAGSVQFMSDMGTSIVFEREAVVINEPFLGSDTSSNDEDVICLLTATVRLQSSTDNLAIETTYFQLENSKLDSDEESLRVDHVVESPIDTPLDGGYLADISVSAARANINAGRVEYLESMEDQEEIGGVSYTDVVKITGLDTSPDTDDEAIDVIQRITMAREFGIVAFTDANDVQFVRVAN